MSEDWFTERERYLIRHALRLAFSVGSIFGGETATIAEIEGIEAKFLSDTPPDPAPASKIVAVNFENDPDNRLVTQAEIAQWLGVSRSTIYELEKLTGPRALPRPVKLGRTKRWRLGALRRWISEREASANKRHL